MSRRLRPWLLLALVAIGTAWLRYGWIEPSAIAHRCEAAPATPDCLLRGWVVRGFLDYGYGYAALLAAALALWRRRPWLAWLAAALGVFALELYCAEAGALALLLGCVLLVRAAAQDQRQREGQVEAQP
ncbi:hypothetical protein [Aerosticca soli]|jgi:hypothetical protein|uniref:hypothetical protein n=1 Tax=Aerosticca soli TaxID=2010829 RepID=UPI000F83375E|nr:hypothetical protein [Aerosticca soli]MDI3262799.1 hypothetical protein [Fulvimonas sp.]